MNREPFKQNLNHLNTNSFRLLLRHLALKREVDWLKLLRNARKEEMQCAPS
jgi:hypothetical protein